MVHATVAATPWQYWRQVPVLGTCASDATCRRLWANDRAAGLEPLGEKMRTSVLSDHGTASPNVQRMPNAVDGRRLDS